MRAAKYTKEEVSYSDRGRKDAHCAICKHYKNATTCRIVTGTINPRGWCKKFDDR